MTTNETFVIRRSGDVTTGWCLVCGTQREMVAPEVAAVIGGVDKRTVYRWIESGSIHFTETQDRMLLVCLYSLPITWSMQ